MATNKVKFGIKNVHYAPESAESSQEKVTYEEPKPIYGAVNLTFEAAGDESSFYADDMKYYNIFTNQGYTGELEVAIIPDDFETNILGKTQTDQTHFIVENVNDKAKKFALLFEIDGDVKARRHVFYGCSASRPNTEASTKTESTEPKTDVLTFTAVGLPDGTVKLSTTDQTPEDVYNRFFEKVWLKEDAIGG